MYSLSNIKKYPNSECVSMSRLLPLRKLGLALWSKFNWGGRCLQSLAHLTLREKGLLLWKNQRRNTYFINIFTITPVHIENYIYTNFWRIFCVHSVCKHIKSETILVHTEISKNVYILYPIKFAFLSSAEDIRNICVWSNSDSRQNLGKLLFHSIKKWFYRVITKSENLEYIKTIFSY